jgi:hypothetical protein
LKPALGRISQERAGMKPDNHKKAPLFRDSDIPELLQT